MSSSASVRPRVPRIHRFLSPLVQAARDGIWLVPATLALAGLGLSRLAVFLDRDYELSGTGRWVGYVYDGSIETGRAILSALMSSTITVTGLVLSITVVALTFASSQLGPRLLTVFRRDRVNQVVIGCFLGTYVFSLSVLASISDEGETFAPGLSVTIAMVLAATSFCVLLLFVHRLARTLQADNLIALVRRDLDGSLERFYPPGVAAAEPPPAAGVDVPAPWSGYVQGVDFRRLREVAEEPGLAVAVLERAGQHVLRGTPVLRLDARVDDETRERLLSAFVVGSQRTDQQDVEYAVHQLVEIALRALSPGINDAFTAISVVDQLGAALAALADRPTPAWYVPLDGASVRARGVPFDALLASAWDQVREHGAAQPAVAIRMLQTLTGLARAMDDPGRRACALRHGLWTFEGLRAAGPAPCDLDDARRALEALRAAAGADVHFEVPALQPVASR